MAFGVYKTSKKDGSISFRASVTYKKKHISLGSFSREKDAAAAVSEAQRLYKDTSIDILNYRSFISILSEDKAVILLNFRDNKIYIGTPIYLRSGYFSYFLKGVGELKFDNDDLFYYSEHRILVHDGHLYVNDYGMQYGILARYGIKNFAVAGKDYTFANGDDTDYRYSNIIVVNRYHGVTRVISQGRVFFETRIHINGEYLIGRFDEDSRAAVAYNKAADLAIAAGIEKNFIQNYVVDYSPRDYAAVYTEVEMPKKYLKYLKDRG